jgi:hypothetical protein
MGWPTRENASGSPGLFGYLLEGCGVNGGSLIGVVSHADTSWPSPWRGVASTAIAPFSFLFLSVNKSAKVPKVSPCMMLIWGLCLWIVLQVFSELLSRGYATVGTVLPLLLVVVGRPSWAKWRPFFNLLRGGPYKSFSLASNTFSPRSGAWPVALRWLAVKCQIRWRGRTWLLKILALGSSMQCSRNVLYVPISFWVLFVKCIPPVMI